MKIVRIYIRKHVLVDGLCRFSVAYTEGRGGVADMHLSPLWNIKFCHFCPKGFPKVKIPVFHLFEVGKCSTQEKMDRGTRGLPPPRNC